MSSEGDETIIYERLSTGIKELLEILAENEIDVPARLKDGLLETLELHRFSTHTEVLEEARQKRLSELAENNLICEFQQLLKTLKAKNPKVNVRLRNGSYTVNNYVTSEIKPFSSHRRDAEDDSGPRYAKQKIKTVSSESPINKLFQCVMRCFVEGDVRAQKEEKVIMENVDLALETGKMYLVLGAPRSGKSTLLKMIANNLHKSKDHIAGGDLSISGIQPSEEVIWTNLTGYIDQIDRLHPFLTVMETCAFAWHCRSGGTHRQPYFGEGSEVDEAVDKMDDELYAVKRILDAMGLTGVVDTFVGDQTNVRGVSGGEKKRVTVAEMLVIAVPVLCCDEISTGLDAATTYDITKLMGAATRITNTIKIVSLLQPPPETVANFDELILLSEGRVIYCGPVEDVIEHFNSLGYEIPERVDVADWLQALPTKDGWEYLKGATEEGADTAALMSRHLSPVEFHEKFYESNLGQKIREEVNAPESEPDEMVARLAKGRYKNSLAESLSLLIQRELLLWWRDKYQIKAKVAQTVIMGTVVGTLFFQQNDNPNSLVAVLFQNMFYCIVGAMTVVVKQFPERGVFYKQQDANFYPAWCYVVGRSVASIPNAIIDAVGYGSMVYFLVGLAYNDGATIGNYFTFLLVMFTISLVSGVFFSMYSASLQTVTVAQAAMAVTAVLFVLFSGFTVQPDVIPEYWIWAYWASFCSWSLRGLIVNEFDSGKYDALVPGTTQTEGELILTRFGFTLDDEPFTSEWTWWGLLFTMGSGLLAVLGASFCLKTVRYSTGRSLMTDQGDEDLVELSANETVDIPFKKVDLTFRDIHYTVQSSITNEKLELLKGVDGVVESGKMTALMGSSGAGKTTLMDVLALRKTSGEVSGEVCLNGHPQEEISFRRCTGYVEQFDVQSAQLTIRETVEFSALLRLEESDPLVTPEHRTKFVNQTLSMLELTNLQNLQVGTDAEGGLSFEQKKRLSIAVEIASNPSILFLDEPTSGLDARAAAIVMRGMKRVALSGRAVCATIHQPSVAIFNEFDTLLLLKRGGEVVFYGDLGDHSSHLIEYFERFDSTPRIQPGENPATWMLTTIGAGSTNSSGKPFDYAGSYAHSRIRNHCLEKIEKIVADKFPEGKVSFDSKFAASFWTQSSAVLSRTIKVYFRSPSYNVTRVLVSGIVALLFASVYASQRVPEDESDMNSRINSIFVAVLFLCVNAQNSVLSVFEAERNMFYRHRAVNMYGSSAIGRAMTLAEIPFILMTSIVFVILFYFIMGFATEPDKFFLFFLFSTFGLGSFTYCGQMLVSLFRDGETAQGFGGLVVSMTAMFSGILIRPSEIPPFWIFMYWVFPGHYLMEGLIMSQFDGDDTEIQASPGSPFFVSLGCDQGDEECQGTAEQWIESTFEDWSADNVKWNITYFIVLLILTRVVTYVALTRLDYRAN